MPVTLPILTRLGATAGTALVAVWALSNARPIDLYQAETDTRSAYAFGNNWSDRFLNSSWAGAVALAVVVVAVWLGTKRQVVPVVGAIAGLVVLAAPSVLDVPTGLAPTTTGVGAKQWSQLPLHRITCTPAVKRGSGPHQLQLVPMIR